MFHSYVSLPEGTVFFQLFNMLYPIFFGFSTSQPFTHSVGRARLIGKIILEQLASPNDTFIKVSLMG